MTIKFIFLLAALIGVSYAKPQTSYGAPPPQNSYGPPPPTTNGGVKPTGGHVKEPGMPYDFQWAVNDPASGNDYSHQEQSDGNVVTGEYRVLLPDSRVQIVRFTADHENGYQAEVTYEGEAIYPEQSVHQPTYVSQPTYNSNQPSYSGNRNYVRRR